MIDNFVEKLIERAKIEYEPYPEIDNGADLRKIGHAVVNDIIYNFTCDYDYIFANNLPILSLCNDRWTGIYTFDTLLESILGPNFYKSAL